MILTEEGLTFRRDGAHRRCVEHPEILALGDRHYVIEGRPETYATAHEAHDVLTGRPSEPPRPTRRRR